MATLLNVLGLSTAFAAFMVIIMQVDYDRSFDRMHPEAGRIFRADLMRGDARVSIHGRALVDALIASSPRIEAGALINPYVGSVYLTAGEGEERHGFREPFVTCYPELIHIFGFSFVEGDSDCLNEPDNVIIPLSMARRMFGSSPAAGRTIAANEYIWTKERPNTFTVGGVYLDFPGNTQLNNAVYTAIDETMKGMWDMSNFVCYLLVDGGSTGADVEEEVNTGFDFSRVWNDEGGKLSVSLTPLTGIYLSDAAADVSSSGVFKTGNAGAIRVLLTIALLVIIIAGINFTNFSIAMAPSRVRGINVQKVLGGSTAVLRCAIISEAVLIALVSWVAAVVMVGALESYHMLSFMEGGMNPADNIHIVLLAGGIAMATGLVAGLYPAWYVTSLPPAMALSGRFALSGSGRRLRACLTGCQFTVSICLIVCAGFIQLQNSYMRAFDRGFEQDKVVIVELNRDIYSKDKDAYVNALMEHPGIEDVAFAKQKLGSQDVYSTYNLTHEGMTFDCYVLDVSYNFLRVMGIPVIDGRDFMPADEKDEAGVTYIFNSVVHDELQLMTGSLIELGGGRNGRTAGIIGNLKFTSLRRSGDRIALIVNTGDDLPVSFIRLKEGGSIPVAVSHIRKTLAGIDPSYPFDIEFYDGIFHQVYRKEEYLNRSISMLSLLAIMISIMGVFGMVVFESEYRRKEIGIRRVFGSTARDILVMFNMGYIRILCICFAVAAPVAWYAVRLWLTNFAYRTPLYWWVFAAAFITVGTLTIAVVTIQTRSAALANPSDALKTE
jgi:putative ABC transport system permease protein